MGEGELREEEEMRGGREAADFRGEGGAAREEAARGEELFDVSFECHGVTHTVVDVN